MPSTENLYSHPPRSALAAAAAAGRSSLHRSTSDPAGGVHSRSSSLTNLARLPGMARAKLQNLQHRWALPGGPPCLSCAR